VIVSVLTRKSRIKDREVWQAALETVAARIGDTLKGQPGFVSVEYFWDVDDEGAFAQVTTWESPEACKDYIRNGPAATVATMEEAALPTAPYPDGAWVRRNYESAGL
jgi:heme-degrading monooxygenase HmoA